MRKSSGRILDYLRTAAASPTGFASTVRASWQRYRTLDFAELADMLRPKIFLLCAGAGLMAVAFAGTRAYLRQGAVQIVHTLETEAFAKGGTGPWILKSGWSIPEKWGTWSVGPVADLVWTLRKPPVADLSMWIDGRIYPRFAEPLQQIRVSVNGARVATIERNVEGGLYGARFKIPLAVATAQKPMLIVFEIANPTSPHSLNDGTDMRRLGIGLVSIEIDYDSY